MPQETPCAAGQLSLHAATGEPVHHSSRKALQRRFSTASDNHKVKSSKEIGRVKSGVRMYGDVAGKGGGVANAQYPLLQLPALESS